MNDTLTKIVEQLELCEYQTADGLHDLKMNAAFIALKELAAQPRLSREEAVGKLSEIVQTLGRSMIQCAESFTESSWDRYRLALRNIETLTASYQSRTVEPIDVILFCPKCKEQHIDEAELDVCESCGGLWADHQHTTEYSECKEFKAWLNPPHKKHRCHSCNHVWKAAAVPTNGVAEIEV